VIDLSKTNASAAPDLETSVSIHETGLEEKAQSEVEHLRWQLAVARNEIATAQQALSETKQALVAREQTWEEEVQNKQRQWEEEHHSRTTELESRLASSSQELRENNRLLTELRNCLDIASTPIIAVDRAGFIVEWNKVAAQVFDYGSGNLLLPKRQMADFLCKEDRETFQAFETTVMSSLSGSSELQYTTRTRSTSSDKLWQDLIICGSPRRTIDGVVAGAFYIVQDLTVTSRNRMKQELLSEELLRRIQAVNATFIGVDQQGIVIEWNKKAELLTGFQKEEALGKNLVKNFITPEFAESVRTMLSQSLQGQEITNHEFPLVTKSGQRRDILWSAAAQRDRNQKVVGVLGVGQDITELRSESKMLANYVRICGAAVWSLRGNAMTGAVTECKTKEIEHLISQQAQMDIWDPRMVLWRASFVSILKTMCQNFWVKRKSIQSTQTTQTAQSTQDKAGVVTGVFSTNFGYEFCFEAPNGQVKWYKVHGHLIQESSQEGGQFEVSGSMQEVTSMMIDKVMGDRWQKWWNRMCHMVFDATLLVDTQEYRVLNAWGEEKVFGCKLQSHHPVLQLIKPEDIVSLTAAFNEVTFKGFERGRTLHLLRPGKGKEMPAQCFLLSGDQENPNECMMGIRMQVSGNSDDCSVLWDVAKPNPVLTLEDLARLKSGLKRHRRPTRNLRSAAWQHHSRSSDPHTSSHSLSSIPEDLHGESEESDQGSASEPGESVAADDESLRSSSKSSTSSKSSNGSISEVGVCNSSPAGSASEEPSAPSPAPGRGSGLRAKFQVHPKLQAKPAPLSPLPVKAAARVSIGPPYVKLKFGRQSFDLNLDHFKSIAALRAHIYEVTKVPPKRQTLILSGRRLPWDSDSSNEDAWKELKDTVRPGQTLMMLGTVPSVPSDPPLAAPASSGSAVGQVAVQEQTAESTENVENAGDTTEASPEGEKS